MSINLGDKDMVEVGEQGAATQDAFDEVDHRHGAGKVLQYYHDMGQEK